VRAIRRLTVRPVVPAELAALEELAGNLRGSWHPPTQDLLAEVGPWEPERLAELARDPGFLARLDEARRELHDYLTADRWYQRARDAAERPRAVAYFSPEYGIAAELPQYSGGLGILAGDHLKTASDLGVPLVGVGLLYRHGYFRQALSRDGWQEESYPALDAGAMPLSLLREPDGTAARVTLGLPGGELRARIWVAQVGRVPLLLLDSDVEDNDPELRGVTDRLYGGTSEHRLRQELLLGVGGVRALRVFSRLTGAPEPEVFHTNEGHAGFLGLERIRELLDEGLDFDAALERSRAGTVFTTHTPVPAGIDRFPRELVEQYAGGGTLLPGVPVDRLLALGCEDYDGGDPGVFNMAVMGFRLAQRANGVSQLHGHVSREMFHGLWPAFDEGDVPIGSITNGVHAPTWMAREVVDLAVEAGADLHDPEAFGVVEKIPAGDLWRVKRLLRERLVRDVRRRLRESLLHRGASPAELGWVDSDSEGALDPDVLTIGFARRVPSYKRLTLMLRDPERLKALLLHPERPVQLVIAGKAHPADDGGKALIQQIVRFADDPEVRHRIVFLPDYDIAMAQPLYPGCDVWLNNPLRPYEACGTSGMKAALNGGLNLSILDGWWDEWFDPGSPGNGWAIPSADGVDDPDRRDDLEATALYDLLEGEVARCFYDVDAGGVPQGWVAMVRHTLTSLGPKVLATRMLRDYVDDLYTPAARAARAVAEPGRAAGLAEWKHRVRAAWRDVRVEHVEAADPEVVAAGESVEVSAFVALGSLEPGEVDVQLLHGPVGDDDELVAPAATSMALAESYDGARHRFTAALPLQRPGALGWTVRVVPRHELMASPAELGCATLP
jgi:starch phosphorylase